LDTWQIAIVDYSKTSIDMTLL